MADTGIGIPEDSLGNIFDAFTQVHEGNNQKYGGTGLGLAIIKRLLELQGSKIEVKSILDKGSNFSFELSFSLVDEQLLVVPLDTEFTPARRGLQEASLLLVEDNPLNLLVLVQFFEIWGMHPDVAENGLQAISKIREKAYDLVLMDLHMPELDGIEATRLIRNELGLADLPIIALTANALPGIRQKVLNAGMNDYVCKPFEPEALFQKVMQYLPQTTAKIKAVPVPTAPEVVTEKLYSLHKLYQQSNNNTAFVERMANLFIKTCGEQLLILRTSLEQGEAATVRDVAHRLKPSIDLFDIRCQSQAVRKLELMELTEMQTPEGWQVAENLTNSLKKVINQLQDWLNEQAKQAV